MFKYYTSQRQSEYTNKTVKDVKDSQVDRVEMHEDRSLGEVTVKLAADQHFSISSSSPQKSHTSQRQSGSVTTMVEYEKDTLVDREEMTANSSSGGELGGGQYHGVEGHS